jgi:hypothetical protein
VHGCGLDGVLHGSQAMNDDTTVEQRLWLWADELRAVANEGLHFDADDP